ncbi:MAG TPA: PfkB family carbohydrate kinase [Vicinamibacterales bacterium]|nr:PfkB family carbohydrate kinase [Vicinamibacterales bacterium]
MSDPKWDVLGVGCNSVDYVYRLPASPRADSPTAKLRITSHHVMCGGQTATAMAACAGLGLRAAYLGAIGHDHNGRTVRDELQRRGVDVSAVLTRECANRFAVITVDETSGERVVLWDRDDRLNLSPRELDPALIRSARLVHVDDEDQEAAIAAATIARQAGIPTTSDIDRLTSRTKDLVTAVSIPMFGEHVLPGLTGESDPERGLRALRQWHDGVLCVTLGPRGAMLMVGDQTTSMPAFSVTAVDTTAAGDVFRAGFIRGYLAGYEPKAILEFANAAAAIGCTRAGAMASVPELNEVEAVIGGRALR